MDNLLTLPPNSATFLNRNKKSFPGITAAYSDLEGKKLGSGGGTVHVLHAHENREGRRMIIHSDGQSRRLPAYAAVGKCMAPCPVFKWSRGQHINQTLFDVQRPFLEKILNRAPHGMNTLVASGDALLWVDNFSAEIPSADVVCIGVWAQPEIASRHGVFICPRADTSRLAAVFQKPTIEMLQSLAGDHVYLLDSGIWLLSDKAVAYLFQSCGWNPETGNFNHGVADFYDLYTDFGKVVGTFKGEEAPLTVRIMHLNDAEFFHFGSNTDLLRSTGALHNRIHDQRQIWHKKVKPAPDIFVQNAFTGLSFTSDHSSIWIENSYIPDTWKLHHHHILTGVPENNWCIEMAAGACLEIMPVGESDWCVRFYGFYDHFRGDPKETSTTWMNHPILEWFIQRGFPQDISVQILDKEDIFDCPLFPVMQEGQLTEDFLGWMISVPELPDLENQGYHREFWLKSERLSAREIISRANLSRHYAQRDYNLKFSLHSLAANYKHSVFYQLDLQHLASEFLRLGQSLPAELPQSVDIMTGIHDYMFRSLYFKDLPGGTKEADSLVMERKAFDALRYGMLKDLSEQRVQPVNSLHHDQLLWGRSPLRLDLAGGWTDTPPYCILNGGSVVNMAVELNGQPPIQVFIRPAEEPVIVIHSIDLGVSEVVREYQDLELGKSVGSAFSIPKAALMMAGFHPEYSAQGFKTLKDQLRQFGGGFDLSLMVAVPKGSGLGTSSILAATILECLSDFCTLGWDHHETSYRTLLLEQMLTTGGGWQDQLGGIFPGIKLIESTPGLIQRPVLRWAPDHLFTSQQGRDQILLYYTGITRVAKHILADIVRGMFLNSSRHLEILAEMKHHAEATYEAIQHHDWSGLTSAIRYSWELNQRLDAGTNPPGIDVIIREIDKYMVACKLLGAGGGGYLLIFAKDPGAAQAIRKTLEDKPVNRSARFVDWRLSNEGFQLSRS